MNLATSAAIDEPPVLDEIKGGLLFIGCAMSTGDAAIRGPFLDDPTMACLTEASVYLWVRADGAAGFVRVIAN